MTDKMGVYRLFVSMYYSRKNFMFMSFVLALLMMVYFYLPYRMHHRAGTHYLNPKINQEVVKPHAGFHPLKDGPSDSENNNIKDLNLKPIPEFITERRKCPACFGQDLCPDIESGAIKILVPEDDGDVLKVKGVYNGYWKGSPVVIKRLNKPEEYAKVDAFLCKNASMEIDCDVSKAILTPNGLVQQEKAFHPDFLREAWKIMHDRPDKLPVAACLSEDAIKLLSEEFDTNKDQQLSSDEKANFFMSMVFNPESLFLEFAKKEGLKIHFPEILGRCGRIVVTEHAGVPLASYIDRPFKERADLAMMLLGMIFFLQNFSAKWSLVFSDFNFDNFYVKDNNLYIVDAEDMLVTDTHTFPEPRERDKSICNHDCMEKFALRLFDYQNVKREDICPLTPGVTEQAMYALACERILSYLPEHQSMSPFKGLLHDPPEEVKHFLDTSLKECVSETTPEGRISSIDVLSEMLEKFTDYGNYMYNGGNEWWDGANGDHDQQEPNQGGQNGAIQAQVQQNPQPGEQPNGLQPPAAVANVQQMQQQDVQQPAQAQPAGVEAPGQPQPQQPAVVEAPGQPQPQQPGVVEAPGQPQPQQATVVEAPGQPQPQQAAVVEAPGQPQPQQAAVVEAPGQPQPQQPGVVQAPGQPQPQQAAVQTEKPPLPPQENGQPPQNTQPTQPPQNLGQAPANVPGLSQNPATPPAHQEQK